jgi:hypothetical protein
MSETPTKTAEPTENQGGGTALNITTDTTVDDPEEPAAEPTENQGGGGD